MPTWEGMFKVRGKNGEPNKVMISDGDYPDDIYIDEADYRTRLYNPPFEKLNWSNETDKK